MQQTTYDKQMTFSDAFLSPFRTSNVCFLIYKYTLVGFIVNNRSLIRVHSVCFHGKYFESPFEYIKQT